jgi:hypothetical protein
MGNADYKLNRITLNYSWIRVGQHDCSGQANYAILRIIITYWALARFKLVCNQSLASVRNITEFLSRDIIIHTCSTAAFILVGINYKS